nr:bone morphogenetic protein receptor type-2-like [Pocillopora verrucosa]XP_058972785.1 bone morphogenetic protein receptor type-2-like [Pocillopora verrucosa]
MEDSCLLFLLVITSLMCVNQGSCEGGKGVTCESYHPEKGILNGNETCDTAEYSCFVLWKDNVNERNETFYIVLKKGCFQVSVNEAFRDCKDDCIQNPNYDAFRSHNVSGFCCCNIHMCNRNFTPVYYTESTTTTATTDMSTASAGDRSDRVAIVVACVMFVVLAVCMTVGVIYAYKSKCFKSKYDPADPEEKEPPGPELDISGLHFEQMVGQGRYGSVWRCYLKGEVVAVKVFPPGHRGTWESEREVYEGQLSHPSILRFYFATQRQQSYGPEYLLVTEYHSKGSLLQYLKCNTVTWQEMCSLGHSLSSGLAYLHNDDNNEGKPCFVHRDISSKNILVSPNITCVLSDFGFAMKMPEIGATKGSDDIITEVGTLRYMAPEVLDGAVNLRECEASLKEIDVYAMSIVLWEVGMRWSDIYGNEPVPDFRPPFEAELGSSITSEDIQDYVARQKKRPGFPDVWKHNHPGLRTLKETIEDCWDQDGDARLSALCVKERFSELLKDYPDGLVVSSSGNPVQKILQNYPTSHSQSLSSVNGPVSNAPPIIATYPWVDKSSSNSMTMTTV